MSVWTIANVENWLPQHAMPRAVVVNSRRMPLLGSVLQFAASWSLGRQIPRPFGGIRA